MRWSRAAADYRGAVVCGALAAAALVVGVLAAVTGTAGLAVLVSLVCVCAAALGALLDVRGHRAEDSLRESRAQARQLRRRLDVLEAERSEEHLLSAPALRTGERRSVIDDLPEGTDTTEWEIDPVSGLLRERHLPVVLQQAVAAARRKVVPLAVVMWELDELVDAPTAARDQAVTALAAVAWRTLRESDAVFRLGDVVALAVLADTAEPGAVIVAERVRDALRESPVGDSLTVSAAIACYPTHALDAAELVSRAGRALEGARAEGHLRNHVAVAAAE
jgi:diguanylate cyclase (GGDEF)-like protein